MYIISLYLPCIVWSHWCLCFWHILLQAQGAFNTESAGTAFHTHARCHTSSERCISTSLARKSWQQSRSKTLWCRISPAVPLNSESSRSVPCLWTVSTYIFFIQGKGITQSKIKEHFSGFFLITKVLQIMNITFEKLKYNVKYKIM